MNKLPFLIIALFLLVACGGEATQVAPAPTTAAPTLAATAAVSQATTEEATAVPATFTPVAPPATMPPPAIATAIPTSTAAPTAEVSQVVLQTAAQFAAENRNPLTGEVVADPAVLQRRPLAVKISNAPASYVRPQSGLNAADIVFEHITEAVVTRFTVLFYSEFPETVGPIRSARLVDVELPAMYDAALSYSGTSAGVGNRLFQSDFASRVISTGAPGYYRTGDTSKPYEHTLYAYPERLLNSLGEENRAPQFGSYMAFSSEAPAGGTAASTISIDFRSETVEWRYDPETNLYYRWAAGVPHNDGETNEQVFARNIVIPFANHVNDPTICEQIAADGTCQLLSVQVQLWGQGQVIIFRDGQRYDGIWKREGRNDMLTFYDAAGNPLPLQIGNTWVEIMSIYYDNPVVVTP